MANKFRILHIGNIANNAYLNAKFLREKGYLSDVICYDYFHVMGTPEWEDADWEGDHGDDFNPDWAKVNLHGFKRPEWFMQGFLEDIYQKNYQHFDPNPLKDNKQENFEVFDNLFVKGLIYFYRLLVRWQNYLIKKNTGLLSSMFHRYPICYKCFSVSRQFIKKTAISYYLWAKKQLNDEKEPDSEDLEIDRHFKNLIKEFKKYFPNRKDQLTMADLLPYRSRVKIFRRIFKNYDLVQGYATDPMWPMLTNFKPYTGYEHGTLRDFPFEDSSIGRLTALSYRKADLVFITNGDAIKSVKKLGIKKYVGLPHPISEQWIRKSKNYKNNSITLFCPLRHDWKIKGTDKYISALAKIKKESPVPVKLVMIKWGNEIDKSLSLIKKLGLENDIIWYPSMPKKTVISWTVNSDIICDQIALPHFGATAPLAMACQKPVLMSYEPWATNWLFKEKAPIIPVFDIDNITKAVLDLIMHPEKRQKIGKAGSDWFKKYHASKEVSRTLIENYKKIIKDKKLEEYES